MHHPLFASLNGLEVGVILGGIGLLMGVVFGVFGMYFHHRRQELWHATARAALEKGQPLPPQLDDDDKPSAERQREEERNDLRSGLIMVATGAGIFLFFGAFLGKGFAYMGFIPGFIGVALLLYGLLSHIFRKPPRSENHPPKA